MGQGEVATAIGVDLRTVRRWEKDESVPREESRMPLVQALDIRDAQCLAKLGIDPPTRLALIEGALGAPSGGTTPPSKDDVLRAMLRGLNKGFIRGDNYVEVARQLARETGIEWT